MTATSKESAKKGVLIPEFKGINQLFPVLEWLVYPLKWPGSADLSTFLLSNNGVIKE
ncbi:hypothetical protein FD05_GL000596 [Lentilactobacillus otakiensis DSM 19908 = JCM 15040]|uniref:Uncharacterized protein n=1 Tax=Lentilactobacillus otakiensis DSM 19908 = JCM 15040 TaxID=1423780 RepID=S4NBM1_9LACO|nr:hypothetical protein FD05_GL000596 [Lentilactobacillus otakiensis DSM 19908 = JCM 15040]GAD16104.1 hypothetical protein LOT_0642 [Lentilactobacillus otakiensis DSM 19908 = JCM 15040]